VGLIYVLILIVSLQIWLLSASVNTSLGGHADIAWPAFYASLALFLASVVTLSYLPLPIRLPIVVEREEAFADAWVGQRIQPFWIEDEARKLEGTNFIVNSMFKAFAVRDGNLITGQQQFSGAAAARLVIEALGV